MPSRKFLADEPPLMISANATIIKAVPVSTRALSIANNKVADHKSLSREFINKYNLMNPSMKSDLDISSLSFFDLFAEI